MRMVHFIPPEQRRLAMQAAQDDSHPVLISGQPGTGKGAIAEWIHEKGPRGGHSRVDSTLSEPISNQIHRAANSTLLVHEIGTLPLADQAVLLRFLKTRSLAHPQSEETPMILNVRIIATTDHALDSRAMGGLFNGELLSLFGIYRIAMPPLVNRQEEFHEIAKEILAEIRLEIKKSYIQDFSPLALEKLKSHSWPGNIRELRNVIQLAAVQCEQPQIQVADLPHFEDSKVNLRATRDEFGKIYYSELLNIYKRDLYKVASITGVSLDDLTEKLKSLGLDTK